MFIKHWDTQSQGLNSLMEYSNIEIQGRNDEKKYSISVEPKNGHGHSLKFDIIKATGELTAPVSFHMIPSPPIRLERNW